MSTLSSPIHRDQENIAEDKDRDAVSSPGAQIHTPNSPLKRRFSEVPENISPNLYQAHSTKRRELSDRVSPLLSYPESGSSTRTHSSSFPSSTSINNSHRSGQPTNQRPATRVPPLRQPIRVVSKPSVLDCQKESMQRELTRTQKLVEQHEGTIQELEIKLRRKAEQVRYGNPDQERENIELRDTCNSLSRDYNELREKYNKLKSQQSNKNSDLELLSTELNDHHAKLEEALHLLESMKSINGDLKQQANDLQEKNVGLQGDLVEQTERVSTLTAEKDKLSLQNTQNAQNAMNAQDKLVEITEKYTALSSNHHHLSIELDKLNSAKVDIESKWDNLKANTDATERELRNMIASNSKDYENRIRLLQIELKSLNTSTRDELQQMQQDNITLNDKFAEAVALLESTNTEHRNLAADYDKLQKVYNDLRSSNEDLVASMSKKISHLESDNDHMRRIISTNDGSSTAMKKRLEDLERKSRTLRQEYIDADLKCSQAEREVLSLKSQADGVRHQNEENNMIMINRLNELENNYKARVSSLQESLASYKDDFLYVKDQLSQSNFQLAAEKAQVEHLKKIITESNVHDASVSLEQNRTINSLKAQLSAHASELSEHRELVRYLQNVIQDLKGNIRIVARVRPSNNKKANLSDLKLETSKVTLAESETGATGIERQRLTSVGFDRVFGTDSTNADVAEECDYLVQSAIDGRIVSIMAYGQTGSGKSWTMNGASGVTSHSLHKIMEYAAKNNNAFNFKISVEAVEIYNEQLRDLLKTSSLSEQSRNVIPTTSTFGSDLSIQHNPISGVPYLAGATRTVVNTESEANMVFSRALRQRSTAATAANERSSRSHFVFSVHIERTAKSSSDGKSPKRTSGVLHLVDLAGSERLNNSLVTGIHAKETKAINTSLSTLGQVINALRNKGTSLHVPFRNSKLTFLLQGSFTGDAKTMLLTNLAPEVAAQGETKSTLRFADNASRATLK